jgi:hypothetical protein
MVDAETIVYIDTNIIRNEQKWETDFSQLNPKGIFAKLIGLVEVDTLKGKVDIGIPETVLLEFIKSKKENFSNIFSTFKNKIPLFEKMDCCDFTQLKLPEDDFDYQEYIKKIAEELNTNKNSIHFIKINWENSKEILENIYHKSIENLHPFQKTTGNGRDKGFKDNLIWETIVGHAKTSEYKNYFLLTENTNDFTSELEVEFAEKINKNIKFISTYEEIERELNIFHALLDLDITVKKHIEDEYFISQLKENISEKIEIDAFSITEVNFEKAIDFSSQSNGDVRDHPELFNLDSGDILAVENLDNHYILFYNISTTDKKYKIEILFDFKNKEILNSYFEEIGDSNE